MRTIAPVSRLGLDTVKVLRPFGLLHAHLWCHQTDYARCNSTSLPAVSMAGQSVFNEFGLFLT